MMMAKIRQTGVVGTRSADEELAEATLVKESKLEASVVYDVGLGEYTTGEFGWRFLFRAVCRR